MQQVRTWRATFALVGFLGACGGTPATDDATETDGTDTEVSGDGCCQVLPSAIEEIEAIGGDTSGLGPACAQFNDTTTYPGTVGQELCEQLSDGKWCEWTCE